MFEEIYADTLIPFGLVTEREIQGFLDGVDGKSNIAMIRVTEDELEEYTKSSFYPKDGTCTNNFSIWITEYYTQDLDGLAEFLVHKGIDIKDRVTSIG